MVLNGMAHLMGSTTGAQLEARRARARAAHAGRGVASTTAWADAAGQGCWADAADTDDDVVFGALEAGLGCDAAAVVEHLSWR